MTSKIILWLLIACLSLATNSVFGQTDTLSGPTVSFTLLQPVGFSSVSNASFGEIVTNRSSGFVTLNPDGTVTSTSGIVVNGIVRPAKFSINGTNNCVVALNYNLPSALTSSTGANLNLSLSNTPPAECTLGSNCSDLSLSPKIEISASQAAGVYAGTITITANYTSC